MPRWHQEVKDLRGKASLRAQASTEEGSRPEGAQNEGSDVSKDCVHANGAGQLGGRGRVAGVVMGFNSHLSSDSLSVMLASLIPGLWDFLALCYLLSQMMRKCSLMTVR